MPEAAFKIEKLMYSALLCSTGESRLRECHHLGCPKLSFSRPSGSRLRDFGVS